MASSPSRFRVFALLAGLGLLVFLALQGIRPRLENPPVLADLQAPANVKAILTTSCYNCHSNETKIPWFDQIVPAYWLVVHDVKSGRRHMNFSNFGQMPAAQQKAFLYESVNQIALGAMPPANYLLIHPGARVTPEQIETLKNYLHPSDTVSAASPEAVAATVAQGEEWIASGAPAASGVAPAPNGLAFFPDYKDWKPVSTTDRFDNGTLRVILGNDIAQKAVASGNIHPWPDGTAFAKIAYKQQPDEAGNIWTGEFTQVEFMLKDATKYKSTEGWGFGRWKTVDHKPYGANANFATECTSCHRPMEANDFVYTMPIRDAISIPSDLFNRDAAPPTGLPHPPLEWNVITTSVDRPHHTMSTLCGNASAVDHARTALQTPYPAGVILALVTWDQQEDRHWFGGRIPGKIRSVEYVTVGAPGADGQPVYTYESYEGSSEQKSAGADAMTSPDRTSAILALKAAAMP